VVKVQQEIKMFLASDIHSWISHVGCMPAAHSKRTGMQRMHDNMHPLQRAHAGNEDGVHLFHAIQPGIIATHQVLRSGL